MSIGPRREPLSLGILGCANIARAFIRDVAPSTSVRVAAVASRSSENAAAFAAENKVARSHGSYEALLADPAIEAVYIPLPNSMHAQWAVKAAAAGKHILCEKPLALNRGEAQEMFDAAARHNVTLLESFPWIFQPQTRAMLALLGDGTIGELRFVQARAASRSTIRSPGRGWMPAWAVGRCSIAAVIP